MKKLKYIRMFMLAVGAMFSIVMVLSFSNTTTYHMNTSPSTVEMQFLKNVAEINLREMRLGQLAQKKASSIPVKELIRKLEVERIKIYRAITALANKKAITLPDDYTPKTQAIFDRLSRKSTTAFERAYCESMLSGHRDAISLFEKASSRIQDEEIQRWALSTLSDLQLNSAYIVLCQKQE